LGPMRGARTDCIVGRGGDGGVGWLVGEEVVGEWRRWQGKK
jgi:hypothetical protein